MRAAEPRVLVWAPCRVDLAGGTLDIWPLGLLHPGSRTVNVAIDVAVELELEAAAGYRLEQGGAVVAAPTPEALRRHPDGLLAGTLAEAFEVPPFSARIRSGSPRGAGLGGSSALTVALLAGLERLTAPGSPPSPPALLARRARDLEARMMGLPTGLQDHYPALLGGALDIEHQPGGERVRRVDVDLDALSAALQVFYSGQSHFSAGNNWQVIRSRLEGDAEVVSALDGVRDAARDAAAALAAGDLAALGAAVGREWTARRRLSPAISTPRLEAALAAALAAGAWGGKACGAGGGGSIAVLAPPERRAAVRAAVEAQGLEALAARCTPQPLRVEVVGERLEASKGED